MGGRMPALDVGELVFLMHVDQHVARERVPQAGTGDLARLKDGVAVGENDGLSPLPHILDDLERVRVEALGERIVDKPVGGGQEGRIMKALNPQALERAEVVGIAELRAQRLEDCPITLAGAIAVSAGQLLPQVVLNPVVVEQCVVDVEQKDGLGRAAHRDCPPLEVGGARSV